MLSLPSLKHFLQVCKLSPTLTNLGAQFLLLRIWRYVFLSGLDFRTKLIRMKHQLG